MYQDDVFKASMKLNKKKMIERMEEEKGKWKRKKYIWKYIFFIIIIWFNFEIYNKHQVKANHLGWRSDGRKKILKYIFSISLFLAYSLNYVIVWGVVCNLHSLARHKHPNNNHTIFLGRGG